MWVPDDAVFALSGNGAAFVMGSKGLGEAGSGALNTSAGAFRISAGALAASAADFLKFSNNEPELLPPRELMIFCRSCRWLVVTLRVQIQHSTHQACAGSVDRCAPHTGLPSAQGLTWLVPVLK